MELFKEKEKKLEDWRDPRFNNSSAETQEVTDSSADISSDDADEDTTSLAIPWQSLESSQEIPKLEAHSVSSETEESLRSEDVAAIQTQMEQPDPPLLATKTPNPSAISLPSLEIVEEIRQLKHEPVVQPETEPPREIEERPLAERIDEAQRKAERGKGLESPSSPQMQLPQLPGEPRSGFQTQGHSAS